MDPALAAALETDRAAFCRLALATWDPLFYSELVGEAIPILQQAREIGITQPIVGGNGFNSPNVLKAVEYANRIGCRTIGLTTGVGGKLRTVAQLPVLVPSNHMGRLEDSFFAVTHILCYAFIEEPGAVS